MSCYSFSKAGNDAIAVDDGGEAVAESAIFATSPVVTQNEAVEAVASVTAGNVAASPVLANGRIQSAFI